MDPKELKKIIYAIAAVLIVAIIAFVFVYIKTITPMASKIKDLKSADAAMMVKFDSLQSATNSALTEIKNSFNGLEAKVTVAIKNQKVVVVCNHKDGGNDNNRGNGVIKDDKKKDDKKKVDPKKKKTPKKPATGGDESDEFDIDVDVDL